MILQVRALATDLLAQAEEETESNEGTSKSNGAFKVPPDIRKSRMAGVTSLLEREYVPFCLVGSHIITVVLTAVRAQEGPRGRSGREAGATYCFRVLVGFIFPVLVQIRCRISFLAMQLSTCFEFLARPCIAAK